jgi:hypothetical protein
MGSRAVSLFDLAVSSDEPSQLEFLAGIPTILSSFPSDWISGSFLPWLSRWLPPNNARLAAASLPHLASLIRSASLAAASALVETLLSPGDPHRTASVVAIVLEFRGEPTAAAFLSTLSQSPWDPVRAAAPQLLGILESDSDRQGVLSVVLQNAPFKVRYSVAKSVPSLSADLAALVLSTLLTDLNGRIRGLLPFVASGRDFFFAAVAPAAIIDHDWSVRAALASALPAAPDPLRAIEIGARLLGDGVWQVKLSALRSLTQIIEKIESGTEISGADAIRVILADTRARYQIPTLKKAIIDLFIALYTRAPAAEDELFVKELVTKEEASVQLHFLTKAAQLRSARLLVFIEPSLLGIVHQLSKSERWRDRLGVVELLSDLFALLGKEELREPFAAFCLVLVKDEASLVRNAAVKQLVNVADSAVANGQLPAPIAQLAASATFRERQAAIMLMQEMYTKTVNPADRNLLRAELQKFTLENEVPNVLSLAQSVIASLPD